MDLTSPPPSPDAETRERLLDELAGFVTTGGSGPLLTSPIEPTAEAFPEPWKPTRAGVETLLRRLLWYANIERAIAMDDQRSDGPPPTERKPETRVAATAVGDRKAAFVIEFIGSDDVVGTLAHEVGVLHAALTRADDAGPYRAADVPVVDGDHMYRSSSRGMIEIDHERDLERGSVASIYLGFGVIATNASFQQYSQGGRFNGAYVPLEYDVLCAGYIPMSSLAFLLAVQGVVRGEVAPPAGLSGPQRDEVAAWLTALGDHATELRSRLGIDDGAVGNVRPEVVPFDDVAMPEEPVAKKIGFRWRTNRGFLGLVAGAALGGGVALAVARTATPIVVVISSAAGHLVGRRIKVPRCTACSSVVAADEIICHHCGAELRGDIAHLSDRLEAEERLDS